MSQTSKPKLFKIKELTSIAGNKDYLLNNFGYKTIHEAKKDFGGNAEQVYNYMMKAYNTQIEKENKTLKTNYQTRMLDYLNYSENKRLQEKIMKTKSEKGNRKINKITNFSVVVSVKCKREFTNGYSTSMTETFELNIHALTLDELKEAIETNINNHYPYDDSNSTVSQKSYSFVTQDKKKSVHKMDVPMKLGKPFKASFLKHCKAIDAISYEDFNGECVIKMLMKYLDIKRETTITDSLDNVSFRLFEKEFEKTDGVTPRMLLEFCKEKNISCLGFDQKSKCFLKHVASREKPRKYSAIFFYACMSHFYLITNKKKIASLSAKLREGNNNMFKAEFTAQKNDTEIEYIEDVSVLDCLKYADESNVIAIINKNDLSKELTEYIHITHDIPVVKFSSITLVYSFTMSNGVKMVCNGCIGDDNSQNVTWRDIKQICEAQGVSFSNQPLGTLVSQLRDKYFNKSRKQFTKEERLNILNSQSNKCAVCKEDINVDERFDVDHILCLASGGTNDRENLQALCVTCHKEKCRVEKEGSEYVKTDNLISSFNLKALEAVNGDFFRKVAFTETLTFESEINKEGKSEFCDDMKGCRRNNLLYAGFDFCRYSVLDDIEEFDGIIKTGFYYIKSKRGFPLRGNGFYAYPAVKYFLENKFIRLKNVKYQFIPSHKIPNDYFHDFVKYLDGILPGNITKLAINSLIGIFGRRKNNFIKSMVCSRNEIDDVASAYNEIENPYEINLTDNVVSVNGKCNIKSISNFFPIHAQILDCEAIELHRLYSYIKRQGGIPYQVKTDAVIYFADKHIDVSHYYWNEENTIPKFKQEEVKHIARPIRVHMVDNYVYEKHKYSLFEEIDDFDLLRDKIIKTGKGCVVVGYAGTGKTFFAKKFIEKLDGKGTKKVAPTNKASLLIDGETIDVFTHKILNGASLKSYNHIKHIIIDEVSMMKEKHYAVFLMLKYCNPDLIFYIFGDFEQFLPVKDCVTKSYNTSRALFELVDGQKLKLQKCRRSNSEVFDLCHQARKDISIDISKYYFKTLTYKNIAYSNHTRKEVNDICNERYLSENPGVNTFEVKALHFDKNSQNYTLAEGMPVISRVNDKTKYHIANNQTFKVKEILENTIVIVDENGDGPIVKKSDFNKFFYLAFCITCHKSQGETYDTNYTIFDWNHPALLYDRETRRRFRYVALSRTTDINNIQIVE
jgi:hypothetical protein